MTAKIRELPGMPERTPLGKKCIEYLNVVDEIEIKEAQKENLKKDLIELFQAEGKKSITVEGKTISYLHLASDRIIVKEQQFGVLR